MSYIVYILLSKKDNKLYIGQTNNLEKRLKEHFDSKVFSTQKRLPLVLIHKENFDSRKNAIKRERFLKSLYGAKEKLEIVKERGEPRRSRGRAANYGGLLSPRACRGAKNVRTILSIRSPN